jgi:hypothetical protein
MRMPPHYHLPIAWTAQASLLERQQERIIGLEQELAISHTLQQQVSPPSTPSCRSSSGSPPLGVALRCSPH